MSSPPSSSWQPPLLARPAHGLLGRHGWVWLAGPGAALLVVGVTISGVLGPAPGGHYGAGRDLAGLVSLAGVLLLVIGLPVRAFVVHRHRRSWAADTAPPSLSGRYPAPPVSQHGPSGSWPAADHHLRRRAAGYLSIGVFFSLFAVVLFAGLALIGVGALVEGVHAQVLQHSSSTQRVAATLDRDTTVHRGRGASYTDHVSYVVDGRAERNVEISVDGARRAGDTETVLVDPDDPRGAISASDHGYLDLFLGGASILALAVPIGSSVESRRRKRRAGRDTARVGGPVRADVRGG